MYPYRIFLSYERRDEEILHGVVAVLKSFGLKPLWDRQTQPGTRFEDELRKDISRSHGFMPIITEHSRLKPWVNQEIGYALSLAIPVIPLSVNNAVADGMARSLQHMDAGEDLNGLRQSLNDQKLEGFIRQPAQRTVVEIVDIWRKRSELIAEYAVELTRYGESCRIRHRGPVTSFAIPDKSLDHPIWQQCGMYAAADRDAREALYQERKSLETHARKAGCSLLINLAMDVGADFIGSREERLKILIEFLERMPDELTTVVTIHAEQQASILIVGDAFSATSPAPKEGGYRQSVIKWHAPTVLRELEAFDTQVESALNDVGISPIQSRQWAISELKRIAG